MGSLWGLGSIGFRVGHSSGSLGITWGLGTVWRLRGFSADIVVSWESLGYSGGTRVMGEEYTGRAGELS